jgi:hypothetical protein
MENQMKKKPKPKTKITLSVPKAALDAKGIAPGQYCGHCLMERTEMVAMVNGKCPNGH